MSRQTRASQRARSPEEEGAGQRNVQPRLVESAGGSARYPAEPSPRYLGKSYFEIRIGFHKPGCVVSTKLLVDNTPGVTVSGGGPIMEIELALGNGFEARIPMEMEARPSAGTEPVEKVPINLLFFRIHTQHTFWYMPGRLPCRDLKTGSPEEEWVTDVFTTEGGTTVHVCLRLVAGTFVPPAVPQPAAAPVGGAGGPSPPSGDAQRDCLNCDVCFVARKSVVLSPCRHLCVCQGCHDTLRTNSTANAPYRCPICRRVVNVPTCMTDVFV